MDLGLQDHIILVTGGAKGIGAQVAKALAAEGAVPVIIGHTAADNTATVAAIAATGNRAFAVQAELTHTDACRQAVDRAAALAGRIDGLVNNAGVNDRVGLERGDTDAFLACEAGGWKGREGTALACREADQIFFHAAAAAAFRRGRLLALSLEVDGRPIALCSNFLSGEGAFAFKTAFDGDFSRNSPGVLLEVELMRRLAEVRGVRWMDSCTAADNDTLNALWPDRRPMSTMLAATGRAPGGRGTIFGRSPPPTRTGMPSPSPATSRASTA